MASRIFRFLSGVMALALCPCVCVWAAPRHGGGAGHEDSRAAAHGVRFGAPHDVPRRGAPRQALAGGPRTPFASGVLHGPSPSAFRSVITPISSHAGRPHRAPANIPQARSGSIRADIARYNEERPFRPDQRARTEPAGMRSLPAFSPMPYSGN